MGETILQKQNQQSTVQCTLNTESDGVAENGATRAQYMIYRYIHQKDSLRDDFPSLQCVLLLHLVTRQGYISKQHRQSELKETLGNVLALIP